KDGRVLHMVEHIDQHCHVEGAIRMGDYLPVKRLDRNTSLFAHEDIDALDSDIGSFLHDQVGKPAVATTDVEYPSISWQKLRQQTSEHTDSLGMNIAPVDLLEQIHRRRSPKILMKKLERMV